ncbi:MAG: DNA mismatch repair endonuclease MutL, partial [Eubacteriales bacterium]|nr:DNA mismatch repair endonuclease MutL [Eubacteriales bacterium]
MQTAKRIQVLSKHTANQIAAGEVVERPASIVKELVENSIDAGSTAITIEINGGGIDYIKITDNGSGILAEDVPTAFLRHATSKISSADDLGHISTLGFRGEALASIAAVSQLTMRTRTKGSESGTKIHIEGGDIKECAECGCAEGTAIEVLNVFYNVPARLKFLKSQRAEGAAISDYAARAIMGNPGVSIKLLNNGKVIYHSPGDGQLRSAIFCIYGGEVLPHIKEVDYDDGRFRITGYVGTERISRPNRQQQSLYINSRYIRSQQISYGVQRAFDTRIMVGKFPFYVLDIGVNYEDVDVNVHPNKMEVRFKDEQGAVRAATIATRMALGDPVAPTIRREDIITNKTAFGSINALNAAVRQEIAQPTDNKKPDKQLSYSELFKPADKSPLKLKEPGAVPTASIRSGMGFKYDSASAMELLRQRYGESVVGPKNARAETKHEVQSVSAAEDIAKKERMLPETAQPDVPVPSAEPETPLKEKPRQAEFGQSHYDIIG